MIAIPTSSVNTDAVAGNMEGSPIQTIRFSPPLLTSPLVGLASTTKDKTEESSFRGAPQEPSRDAERTGITLAPNANAATAIEILRK